MRSTGTILVALVLILVFALPLILSHVFPELPRRRKYVVPDVEPPKIPPPPKEYPSNLFRYMLILWEIKKPASIESVPYPLEINASLSYKRARKYVLMLKNPLPLVARNGSVFTVVVEVDFGNLGEYDSIQVGVITDIKYPRVNAYYYIAGWGFESAFGYTYRGRYKGKMVKWIDIKVRAWKVGILHKGLNVIKPHFRITPWLKNANVTAIYLRLLKHPKYPSPGMPWVRFKLIGVRYEPLEEERREAHFTFPTVKFIGTYESSEEVIIGLHYPTRMYLGSFK